MGALDGVRVIELAGSAPCAFAGTLLADMERTSYGSTGPARGRTRGRPTRSAAGGGPSPRT